MPDGGFVTAPAAPGWQVGVVRMFDVLVDGLRVRQGAGKPAPRRSPNA